MFDQIVGLFSSKIESLFWAKFLAQFLLIFLIAILSFLADFIARRILLRFINHFIKKSKIQWDDILAKKKVFDRLSHLAPAIIIYSLAYLPFPNSPHVVAFIHRAVLAYMIIMGARVINSALNAANEIYQDQLLQGKPIKSYIQVAKIILFVLTSIIAIALILDRSPWAFLSGLGAMTAVILLVFKDTILGFVASIQLSANQMVKVGDWIEAPKYGADGDVIDITINTVKVQNWDKTISTIPTYALITDAFKNWRGMEESGGRRIKRAIHIDLNSIHFLSKAELANLLKIDLLKPYLEERIQSIANEKQEAAADNQMILNGRCLTNIGTFRAYIVEYLKKHPKIHKNMTFLVRQLAPTEKGLPLEIYVFSNDQAWANYEAIQGDIFDHLLAAVSQFNLRLFQFPTGNPFEILEKN